MKNDLGKIEYKKFIIGRAKSQNDIGTKVDRIADDFQKNESSEE